MFMKMLLKQKVLYVNFIKLIKEARNSKKLKIQYLTRKEKS